MTKSPEAFTEDIIATLTNFVSALFQSKGIVILIVAVLVLAFSLCLCYKPSRDYKVTDNDFLIRLSA